jgi:hypothetical protein
MIDETTLADRLADAAGVQDNLLPRALEEDLAAGRRRLRRRRVLTGGTAVVLVGAVAAVTAGLSGPARDAGPVPNDVPVATSGSQVTADNTDYFAQDKALDQQIRKVLARHFDPANKHLDFSSGTFSLDRQPQQRGTSHRVGWRNVGEKGQGQLVVTLSASAGSGTSCGSYFVPPLTCHATELPNGRTAMIGRRGEAAEISYLQEDGESAYLAVDPLFGNNTDIPLKKVGITDAQLMAYVADSELNLPPRSTAEAAQDEQLKDAVPGVALVEAAATRNLTGGQLKRTRAENWVGQSNLEGNWTKGSVTAGVTVSVIAASLPASCVDQLSVRVCTELTLPDGKKVEYGEGARDYQGGPLSVMGATYRQPDGDLAAVRVTYPGKTLPVDKISKDQILALVTDLTLDR